MNAPRKNNGSQKYILILRPIFEHQDNLKTEELEG